MYRVFSSIRVCHLVLLVIMIGTGGCIETYKPAKSLRPKTEQLSIKHRSGGTHYRTLVDGGVWYLLFRNELLIVDPVTGRVSHRQDLADPGRSGPAVDLQLHDHELLVVLRDSAVVRLSLDDPRRPWLEETYTAGELGIRPRGIYAMGDSRLAYGQGGVVDLVSGRQLVAVDGEVTAVAETEDGIVYCIDRRLHRVSDGEFVGSANWLQPIEGVSPDDARRFLFIRNEVNGSLVGFMGSDLREVDANIWTVPIPGTTRHIRQEGDRFIVTSNLVVRIYRVNNDSLQLEDEIEIVGAQDAAMYGEDKVVLAGDFGRGLWRLEADRRGEKDSFAMYHPEPAGLRRAVSDGRNILADSDRGMWLYHIGDDVAQVSIEEVDFSKPSQRAVMLDWSFSIDDGGQTVSVDTPVGVDRLVAPDGGRFYCVTSGDNAVWLSHDSGIIMVRLPKDGIVVPRGWDSMSEEDQRLSGVGPLDGMTKLSVRLDGPVFFLSPLMLGGGVAYVSETAGFGVVSEDF